MVAGAIFAGIFTRIFTKVDHSNTSLRCQYIAGAEYRDLDTAYQCVIAVISVYFVVDAGLCSLSTRHVDKTAVILPLV